MFIILLKFGPNKASAPTHMEGHNAWLKQGFEAGHFLLAGSLQPGLGGGILAQAPDRAAVEALLAEDPFVAEGVVEPEVHELSPARADDRLAFLVA